MTKEQNTQPAEELARFEVKGLVTRKIGRRLEELAQEEKPRLIALVTTDDILMAEEAKVVAVDLQTHREPNEQESCPVCLREHDDEGPICDDCRAALPNTLVELAEDRAGARAVLYRAAVKLRSGELVKFQSFIRCGSYLALYDWECPEIAREALPRESVDVPLSDVVWCTRCARKHW